MFRKRFRIRRKRYVDDHCGPLERYRVQAFRCWFPVWLSVTDESCEWGFVKDYESLDAASLRMKREIGKATTRGRKERWTVIMKEIRKR